jgi:hypothetical protein
MKRLLTVIFAMTTMLSFGQNDVFAMNTPKRNFTTNYNVESTKTIDLKLKTTTKYKSYEKDRTAGVGLLIAGLAFTTASILEGNGNYGTWTHTPNSTSQYNQTYTTKPFMQQTPRQIMLFVGIGFTITGGILSIK